MTELLSSPSPQRLGLGTTPFQRSLPISKRRSLLEGTTADLRLPQATGVTSLENLSRHSVARQEVLFVILGETIARRTQAVIWLPLMSRATCIIRKRHKIRSSLGSNHGRWITALEVHKDPKEMKTSDQITQPGASPCQIKYRPVALQHPCRSGRKVTAAHTHTTPTSDAALRKSIQRVRQQTHSSILGQIHMVRQMIADTDRRSERNKSFILAPSIDKDRSMTAERPRALRAAGRRIRGLSRSLDRHRKRKRTCRTSMLRRAEAASRARR